MSDITPIGRVARRDLRTFLSEHGSYWQINADPDFLDFLPRVPFHTDEFLEVLAEVYADDDVYVILPDIAVDQAYQLFDLQHRPFDPQVIPVVTLQELPRYILENRFHDEFLRLFLSTGDLLSREYSTLVVSEQFEEDQPQPAQVLSAIEIENFKGIGSRQRIELRPLTLLFGANSAGKSSILHALQYATEVFESQNLDAGLIGEGVAGIDLGGFHTFVHDHDADKDIVLAFDVDLGGGSLPSFSMVLPPDLDEPESLFRWPQTAQVELALSWSHLLNRVFVRRYAVNAGGIELAEIRFEPGTPGCELSINERHPIFVRGAEHSAIALWHPLAGEELLGGDGTVIQHLLGWACRSRVFFAMVPQRSPYTTSIGIVDQKDAFPDFDQLLRVQIDSGWIPQEEMFDVSAPAVLAEYLNTAISSLVLGPGRLVRNLLVTSRSLGPIREVPARNHVAARRSARSRWSSGLGAWDYLESASGSFVDAVSQWLGDEDRLDSGYRLRLKKFKELDLSDPLVMKLMSGRAFDDAEADARLDLDSIPTQSRLLIIPAGEPIELRPNDVGAGISQIVPVIVTALEGEGKCISLEQPELHIHPRLQAEVADLFVESLHSRQHRFLIETHSEHLILRLQRRIRETTKGNSILTKSLTSEDLVIYHVSHEGGETRVRRIDVDKNGDFIQPWPDDFFEIDFYERFGDAR